MQDNQMPLVSICCITYNHESYIHAAIEGFLMQKTNFPIEILIHDDASTDNTANIIREYEIKYPDLIKPIYQKENQYSKGISINNMFNFPRARGKYIAFCEGDDYWTDPDKLQKQVDFMEQNPEYGLSHSDYDEFYQDSKHLIKYRQRRKNKLNNKNIKDIYLAQLNHDSYHVRTVTVCVKTHLLKIASSNIQDILMQGLPLSDYPLFLELSRLTKFHWINESLAVHRILRESASHTLNYCKRKHFLKSVYAIQSYFINKYPCPSTLKAIILRKNVLIFLVLANKKMDKEFADEAKSMIPKLSISMHFLYLCCYVKPLNTIYFWYKSSLFGKGIRFAKRIFIFLKNKWSNFMIN